MKEDGKCDLCKEKVEDAKKIVPVPGLVIRFMSEKRITAYALCLNQCSQSKGMMLWQWCCKCLGANKHAQLTNHVD